jgi:hypothetical protein
MEAMIKNSQEQMRAEIEANKKKWKHSEGQPRKNGRLQ